MRPTRGFTLSGRDGQPHRPLFGLAPRRVYLVSPPAGPPETGKAGTRLCGTGPCRSLRRVPGRPDVIRVRCPVESGLSSSLDSPRLRGTRSGRGHPARPIINLLAPSYTLPTTPRLRRARREIICDYASACFFILLNLSDTDSCSGIFENSESQRAI